MNKHVVFLASTAVFLLQIGNCAAMASPAEPARTITVQAKNGEQMTLSQTDLEALQSGFFNQIALPEEQGLPVEAITVLPIASLRPLQLLLPGSQLAEADYDDVAEATILADLLIIPNGVNLFLTRLGEENIKLVCRLYQDPSLEGKDAIKRYIHPFIPYKRTQLLGVPPTIIKELDEVVYNTNPDIGHAGSVASIVLSPDNNIIITGSGDRTAIIWRRGADGKFRFNPQRGRLGEADNTANPNIGHIKSIRSIVLSQDGNTIITGSEDHTAIVWHRGADGQFRFNSQRDRLGVVNNTRYPSIGHTDSIRSVAFSSDDNTIITGSADRTTIVWHRSEDGQFRFNPEQDRLGEVNNTNPDVGHTDSVNSVALSSDGNTIITGSADRTAIIWHRSEDGQFRFNPEQDRLGAVRNRNTAIGHTNWITSMALSSDGNAIITGSEDHTAIVWHRGADGQFRFNPEQDRLGAVNNRNAAIGHTSWIISIALSPDGNTIISGSNDHTAIIWHRNADGQFRFDPERDRLGVVGNVDDPAVGHTTWISSVALSPDDNTIITGSVDHTAIIWQKQQSVDEFCAMQTANSKKFCSIQ